MTIGTLGADLLIVFSLTICAIVNAIILAVLVKHLHWLWMRKREDLIELGDYVANKVMKEMME